MATFPSVLAAQKVDWTSSTAEEDLDPSLGEGWDDELSDNEIVAILEGYRKEAEFARLGGPSGRDQAWMRHLDMYWNRWDFTKKAPWQAREVMPEFPQYVDRFAANMRMALVNQPTFFSVSADNDKEGALSKVIHKFVTVMLRRIGRNSTGQRVDFGPIFEECMKMGALSMPVVSVSYRDDGAKGAVTVEPVDPYNFWVDATGRGIYRIRREELDLHELHGMLGEVDDEDRPIYDPDSMLSACQDAGSEEALARIEKEKRTGTAQWTMSTRKPVVIHEYLCDIIDGEGRCRYRNVVCTVVNYRHLVRRCEPNPFLHGKDWMVGAPIITVPLAPYGRAYAENFAQITATFNEMTNLILDGIYSTAMKVYGVVPGYLQDPTQLNDGLAPGTTLRLIEGLSKAEEAFAAMDMGTVDPNAFQVWQLLKKELQEGAAFNDMTLGNSAPKGRTSATEVSTVDNNSSSYMRAIANNIETLFVEPLLDLVWKTGIQFLRKDDEEMQVAIGPQWFKVFMKMKKEFIAFNVTFVCRGITSLLARKQKLQDFLQLLQICAQNPQMSQMLAQTWPPQKMFAYLALLMDVDVDQLQGTPMELAQMQQQNQQKQAQAQGQQVALTGKLEAAKAGAKARAQYKEKSSLEVLKHGLEHRKEQRQRAAQAAGVPGPADMGGQNESKQPGSGGGGANAL